MQLAVGLLLPFLGTTLGAACVFFMKGQMKPLVQKMLLGFASGVMVAASVWSLLIPAMDMSEEMGKYAFIPAAAGFYLEFCFCLEWTGQYRISIWEQNVRRGLSAL